MIIKVFEVVEDVKANKIDENQKKNINKIFETITRETQLITHCFLDLESENFKESPVYYIDEESKNSSDNFKRVAQDLLEAETKSDGTRNNTIKEGLLFIKKTSSDLIILKLEKLSVIDSDTYEYKLELGSERNYFKVCIFEGDYSNIKIIDKNKNASVYWYERFLKLRKKNNDEDNTIYLIDFLEKDKLFSDNINDLPNYKNIKTFTERFIMENNEFDKSELMDHLNREGLLELNKESDVFSKDSCSFDADFKLSKNVINKAYGLEIQTSNNVVIKANNYLIEKERGNIYFDEDNKMIQIFIDEQYLQEVREKLANE